MATFPPRCFTCGKVIKWEPFEKKIKKNGDLDAKLKALDSLRYKRRCCRRMFLCHIPEYEEELLMYSNV